MKRSIVAGAAALAFLVPAAAQAKPEPPDVPAEIQPPAGSELLMAGHAVGVQIYACNATATGGYAWTFVAPRADLFDERGRLFITHFAGPTWQHRDGSSVVGQVVTPMPSPTGSIPWLLLSKKSATAGAFGQRMTRVTHIQRVNTTGGVAPAAETCNATTAGTQDEVPYTAGYYFWKATQV